MKSDADVVEVLKNYIEEWRKGGLRKEYLTLHAIDCMPVKKVAVEEPDSRPTPRKSFIISSYSHNVIVAQVFRN